MLFNSLEFGVFLPIVFGLYWTIPQRHAGLRIWLLLLASYFFYGWWDKRFLVLIMGMSACDFFIGRQIERAEGAARKRWVTLSLFINLGVLGTFKYLNFFIDSMNGAFSFLGVPLRGTMFHLVLPVGVSFFTFRSMSYVIDVYRGVLAPTRSLVHYLTYVAFFPQLLAGPIERAPHLLPQLNKPAQFDHGQANDALRQILWGFFKKTVVADNCTPLVNDIFAKHQQYSGTTLMVGALLFTFQIYGDFSGYSDIAVGTAKLFGFDLKQNFAYPYFSRNIAEFWRRWHISLSTWFRDYLYIPLGGNRGNKVTQVRNIFIVFLVSGLWHGANWTFVVWGFLHALYFLPLMFPERRRKDSSYVAQGRLLPSGRELGQLTLTFMVVAVAWVFFRAETIQSGLGYVARMFDLRTWGVPEVLPARVMLYVLLMLGIEWLNRDKEHGLSAVALPAFFRWAWYLSLAFAVLLLSADAQTFLYFQF